MEFTRAWRYEKKKRKAQRGGSVSDQPQQPLAYDLSGQENFFYDFSITLGQAPIRAALKRFLIGTGQFSFISNQVPGCLPFKSGTDDIIADCIAWFDMSSPSCVRPEDKQFGDKRAIGTISSRTDLSLKLYVYESDRTRSLIVYNTTGKFIRIPLGGKYRLKSKRLALEAQAGGAAVDTVDAEPMKFIQSGGQAAAPQIIVPTQSSITFYNDAYNSTRTVYLNASTAVAEGTAAIARYENAIATNATASTTNVSSYSAALSNLNTKRTDYNNAATQAQNEISNLLSTTTKLQRWMADYNSMKYAWTTYFGPVNNFPGTSWQPNPNSGFSALNADLMGVQVKAFIDGGPFWYWDSGGAGEWGVLLNDRFGRIPALLVNTYADRADFINPTTTPGIKALFDTYANSNWTFRGYDQHKKSANDKGEIRYGGTGPQRADRSWGENGPAPPIPVRDVLWFPGNSNSADGLFANLVGRSSDSGTKPDPWRNITGGQNYTLNTMINEIGARMISIYSRANANKWYTRSYRFRNDKYIPFSSSSFPPKLDTSYSYSFFNLTFEPNELFNIFLNFVNGTSILTTTFDGLTIDSFGLNQYTGEGSGWAPLRTLSTSLSSAQSTFNFHLGPYQSTSAVYDTNSSMLASATTLLNRQIPLSSNSQIDMNFYRNNFEALTATRNAYNAAGFTEDINTIIPGMYTTMTNLVISVDSTTKNNYIQSNYSGNLLADKWKIRLHDQRMTTAFNTVISIMETWRSLTQQIQTSTTTIPQRPTYLSLQSGTIPDLPAGLSTVTLLSNLAAGTLAIGVGEMSNTILAAQVDRNTIQNGSQYAAGNYMLEYIDQSNATLSSITSWTNAYNTRANDIINKIKPALIYERYSVDANGMVMHSGYTYADTISTFRRIYTDRIAAAAATAGGFTTALSYSATQLPSMPAAYTADPTGYLQLLGIQSQIDQNYKAQMCYGENGRNLADFGGTAQFITRTNNVLTQAMADLTRLQYCAVINSLNARASQRITRIASFCTEMSNCASSIVAIVSAFAPFYATCSSLYSAFTTAIGSYTSDSNFTTPLSSSVSTAWANINTTLWPAASNMSNYLSPTYSGDDGPLVKAAAYYNSTLTSPVTGYTDSLVEEWLSSGPSSPPPELYRQLQAATLWKATQFNTLVQEDATAAAIFGTNMSNFTTQITATDSVVSTAQMNYQSTTRDSVPYLECDSTASTIRYQYSTMLATSTTIATTMTQTIQPFLTSLQTLSTSLATAATKGNISDTETNIARISFSTITTIQRLQGNYSITNLLTRPQSLIDQLSATLDNVNFSELNGNISALSTLITQAEARRRDIYNQRQGNFETDPVYSSLVVLARSRFPNTVEGVDNYTTAHYKGQQIELCDKVSTSIAQNTSTQTYLTSSITALESLIETNRSQLSSLEAQYKAGQISYATYLGSTGPLTTPTNIAIATRNTLATQASTVAAELEILGTRQSLCQADLRSSYEITKEETAPLDENSVTTVSGTPGPSTFTAIVVEGGNMNYPTERATIPGSLQGQSAGRVVVNPSYITYNSLTGTNTNNIMQRFTISSLPNRTLDLNEIILFERALGPAEIDLLTAYLGYKWNCVDSISTASPFFPPAYKLMNSAACPIRDEFYKLIFRDIDALKGCIEAGAQAYLTLNCPIKSKQLAVQAQSAINGDKVSTETLKGLVKGLFKQLVRAEIQLDGSKPYTFEDIKAKANMLLDTKGPVSYYDKQRQAIDDLSGELHVILGRLSKAPALEAICRTIEAARTAALQTKEVREAHYKEVTVPKQEFRKEQMAIVQTQKDARVKAYRRTVDTWDLQVKKAAAHADELMSTMYKNQVAKQLDETVSEYSSMLGGAALTLVDQFNKDLLNYNRAFLGFIHEPPYLNILAGLEGADAVVAQLGGVEALRGKMNEFEYIPTLFEQLEPILNERYDCEKIFKAIAAFKATLDSEVFKEGNYINLRLQRYKSMFNTLKDTVESGKLQVYYLNTYVYLMSTYLKDIKSMAEELAGDLIPKQITILSNTLKLHPKLPEPIDDMFNPEIVQIIDNDREATELAIADAKSRGTFIPAVCAPKTGGWRQAGGGTVEPKRMKQLNKLDRLIIGIDYILVDNKGEPLLDEEYNAIPINPDIMQLTRTSSTSFYYNYGPAGIEEYTVVGVYSDEESFTAYFDRQIRPARTDLVIDAEEPGRTLIDRKDKNGVIRVNFGAYFPGVELPKYGLQKGDYYVLYNQHPRYPLLVHVPTPGPTLRTVLQPGGIGIYIYDPTNDERWYGAKQLNSGYVHDFFRGVPRSRHVAKLRGNGRYYFVESHPTFNEPTLGYLTPVILERKVDSQPSQHIMVECRNFDPNTTSAEQRLADAQEAYNALINSDKKTLAEQESRNAYKYTMEMKEGAYVMAVETIVNYENSVLAPYLAEVDAGDSKGSCGAEIAGTAVNERVTAQKKTRFPTRRVDLPPYPKALLPNAPASDQKERADRVAAYEAARAEVEANGYVITINPADERFDDRNDCYTVTEYIPRTGLSDAEEATFAAALETVRQARLNALAKYKVYLAAKQDLDDYITDAVAAKSEIDTAAAALAAAKAANEERSVYADYGIFYDDDDVNKFFPNLVYYVGERNFFNPQERYNGRDILMPYGVGNVLLDDDTSPKELSYTRDESTGMNIVCSADAEPGFDSYGYVKVVPGPLTFDGDVLKFLLFPSIEKITLRDSLGGVGGGVYKGFLEYNGAILPQDLYRATHCIRYESPSSEQLVFCDESKRIILDYSKNAIIVPRDGGSYDEDPVVKIAISYREPVGDVDHVLDGQKVTGAVRMCIKHQEDGDDKSGDIDDFATGFKSNPQDAAALADIVEITRQKDISTVTLTLYKRYGAAVDFMNGRVGIIDSIIKTIEDMGKGTQGGEVSDYIKDLNEAKDLYLTCLAELATKKEPVETIYKDINGATGSALQDLYGQLKTAVEDAEDTIEEIKAANETIQQVIEKYDVVIRARLNINSAQERLAKTLARVQALYKEDKSRVNNFYIDIGIEYDGAFDDILNKFAEYIKSLTDLNTGNESIYDQILNSTDMKEIEQLNRRIIESEAQAMLILRDASSLHVTVKPRMDLIDAKLLPYYRKTLVDRAALLGTQYRKLAAIRYFYEKKASDAKTFSTRAEAATELSWATWFSLIGEVNPDLYRDLLTTKALLYADMDKTKFPMTIPGLPAPANGPGTLANGPGTLAKGGAIVVLNGDQENTLDMPEELADSESFDEEKITKLEDLVQVGEFQTRFNTLLELRQVFILISEATVGEVKESELDQYIQQIKGRTKRILDRTRSLRQRLADIIARFDAFVGSYFTTILPPLLEATKQYLAAKKTLFMEKYTAVRTAESTVDSLIAYYKLQSNSPDPIIFASQRREILQLREAIRLHIEEKKQGYNLDEAKAYIDDMEAYLSKDFAAGPYELLDLRPVLKCAMFLAPEWGLEEKVARVGKAAARVETVVHNAIIVVRMREDVEDIGDPDHQLDEDPAQVEADFAATAAPLEIGYREALRALIRSRRRERVFVEFRKDPTNSLEAVAMAEASAELQNNDPSFHVVPPCPMGPEFSLRQCFARRYPDVK